VVVRIGGDAPLELSGLRIRRDREWNEGAARKRLLQFLEVVGLEDPWAGQQRRRLSAILFT
jgi:putative thioredoxin